jgi:hypothetical protein
LSARGCYPLELCGDLLIQHRSTKERAKELIKTTPLGIIPIWDVAQAVFLERGITLTPALTLKLCALVYRTLLQRCKNDAARADKHHSDHHINIAASAYSLKRMMIARSHSFCPISRTKVLLVFNGMETGLNFGINYKRHTETLDFCLEECNRGFERPRENNLNASHIPRFE